MNFVASNLNRDPFLRLVYMYTVEMFGICMIFFFFGEKISYANQDYIFYETYSKTVLL